MREPPLGGRGSSSGLPGSPGRQSSPPPTVPSLSTRRSGEYRVLGAGDQNWSMATAETVEVFTVTANRSRTAMVSCRFCGSPRAPRQHRAPGPQGPICTDCLEIGLRLVHDGRPYPDATAPLFVRIRSAQEPSCEFCGRAQRRSFLGLHRPLARMSCPRTGSVVCEDCLDQAGDLLNHTLRQQAHTTDCS